MVMMRIGSLAIVACSAIALAGCTSYGRPYGYAGVTVGTAGGHYDRGYYGDGYYGDPYYGDPYYGWYDNYYYPGAGYYVYDRSGYRHAWSKAQQRYWQARRAQWRGRQVRENWDGYRGQGHREWRDGQRREDRPDWRRGYGDRRGAERRERGEWGAPVNAGSARGTVSAPPRRAEPSQVAAPQQRSMRPSREGSARPETRPE